MYMRILVPIDGSRVAERGLGDAWAARVDAPHAGQ